MNIKNIENIESVKNILLISNFTINLKPVKLLNNVGDNICWWNSFAQLFGTTRNLSILNAMIRFLMNMIVMTIANVGIVILFMISLQL